MNNLYEGSWGNWGKDEASKFLRLVHGMTGEHCYIECIEASDHPFDDDVFIEFKVFEFGRLRPVFLTTTGKNITMLIADEIGALVLSKADEYIAAKAVV